MTQKQSELRGFHGLWQVLWPSWPRANERHIAGRYLYRARSPRTLLSVPGVVALVLGALVAGVAAGVLTPAWLVSALGSHSVLKNEQVVTSMEKKSQARPLRVQFDLK